LLLQEFDLVIKDKKGSENVVADHLSTLVNEEVALKEVEIKEEFPDDFLFLIAERPWFADMAKFKAAGIIPKDLTWQQQKKFFHDAQFYIWDDPHLFKVGADNLLRRWVTSEEVMQSYPARALDRRFQVDWARDPREGPRVLISLRVDFEPMG